jgi:YD repeat-containing protein
MTAPAPGLRQRDPSERDDSSDADGRLTARPTAGGQTLVWDDLGRLTQVKNAAGTVTLATYTYDPLDRLRLVDRGTSEVVGFRSRRGSGARPVRRRKPTECGGR